MPGGEGRTQLEIRMSSWTQSMDETNLVLIGTNLISIADELHVKGRGCVRKDVRQQWEVV